eukprot:c20812_g3_i13.p1 GENE.c20812_g3_i13~~c20812_g3_i13.p1  ORF type:complete len:116 (-),score=21.31 c20812_g3_i13:247-594(-)
MSIQDFEIEKYYFESIPITTPLGWFFNLSFSDMVALISFNLFFNFVSLFSFHSFLFHCFFCSGDVASDRMQALKTVCFNIPAPLHSEACGLKFGANTPSTQGQERWLKWWFIWSI